MNMVFNVRKGKAVVNLRFVHAVHYTKRDVIVVNVDGLGDEQACNVLRMALQWAFTHALHLQ